MMQLKLIGLILVSMLITACETVPDISGNPSQSSSSATAQKGNLPPRDLSSGQCGLFVWTGEDARRFVLFSDSRRNQAAIATETGEARMQITEETGSEAYGQYPLTQYRVENGDIARLFLSDYEDISSGRRYKSGTLTLKNDTGWEQVIPVIGLAVCQPPA